MVAMKFSRMITERMDLQSLAFSCSNKHTDSSAILTVAGGFAIDLTSTKCCFFIDLTATGRNVRPETTKLGTLTVLRVYNSWFHLCQIGHNFRSLLLDMHRLLGELLLNFLTLHFFLLRFLLVFHHLF